MTPALQEVLYQLIRFSQIFNLSKKRARSSFQNLKRKYKLFESNIKSQLVLWIRIRIYLINFKNKYYEKIMFNRCSFCSYGVC